MSTLSKDLLLKMDRIKSFYEEMSEVKTDDFNEMLLEAKSEEEQEFIMLIADFILQKKQADVIARNLF